MKTFAATTMGLAVAITALAGSPPSQAQNRAAPRGSYEESCGRAVIRQGRLYADCLDRRRNIRASSIALTPCRDSDIGNDNGLLVCAGQRGDYESGNGGVGAIGGRNTITVYRDADYRGSSTIFRGEVPNLADTGFNDSISSMQFRGEWLACTDRNFRGSCQSFRNNVRNLDRWGMNDRISSLRPLRGDERY